MFGIYEMMCVSTLISLGLIATPLDVIPAPTLDSQEFQVSIVDEFVTGKFESRYNVENVEICNSYGSWVFEETSDTLVIERVFAEVIDDEGTADCGGFQFFVDPSIADEGETILVYAVYDSGDMYIDEVFVIDEN